MHTDVICTAEFCAELPDEFVVGSVNFVSVPKIAVGVKRNKLVEDRLRGHLVCPFSGHPSYVMSERSY